MQRDFIYFVTGIPDEMIIQGKEFFLVRLAEPLLQQLRGLGEKFHDLKDELVRSAEKFHCIVYRNNFDNEADGFDDAYSHVVAMLDGFAFLNEDTCPEVWSFYQVHTGSETHAILKVFGNRASARLNSNTGHPEAQWATRMKKVFEHLFPFFDVAGENARETELRNQIGWSAKMYAHGRRATTYGIEYLCKFSALEGLVCGSARNQKRRLLRERLGSLFRERDGTETEVEELWTLRCEASHQGKAFSHQFPARIGQLDALTLGTMVFAVHHAGDIDTVDDLWGKAAGYTLPNEILMNRPPEISRYLVVRASMELHLQWNGIGTMIDDTFRSMA